LKVLLRLKEDLHYFLARSNKNFDFCGHWDAEMTAHCYIAAVDRGDRDDDILRHFIPPKGVDRNEVMFQATCKYMEVFAQAHNAYVAAEAKDELEAAEDMETDP
jgi:hypothetical protein